MAVQSGSELRNGSCSHRLSGLDRGVDRETPFLRVARNASRNTASLSASTITNPMEALRAHRREKFVELLYEGPFRESVEPVTFRSAK